MAEMGQPRRLSDLGMSASPPTSDIGLRRCEPTLGAILMHRSKHYLCSITAGFPAEERHSSRTAGQKSATKFSIAESAKPRQNDNKLAPFQEMPG
jgi:hypothetical protein